MVSQDEWYNTSARCPPVAASGATLQQPLRHSVYRRDANRQPRGCHASRTSHSRQARRPDCGRGHPAHAEAAQPLRHQHPYHQFPPAQRVDEDAGPASTPQLWRVDCARLRRRDPAAVRPRCPSRRGRAGGRNCGQIPARPERRDLRAGNIRSWWRALCLRRVPTQPVEGQKILGE